MAFVDVHKEVIVVSQVVDAPVISEGFIWVC